MPDVMAEIEELKKKLQQNPDSLIFVPLADAYRRAGMLDEAIEICKKGLEKHQSYTSARVVLGRIYTEKNMIDEAIEELKRVEAVDVDNIMVHSMLGNAYLKKKRYAEAIEQFQKVLSLNPEDLDTQEKLKEALAAKQEPEKVNKQPQPEPKPQTQTQAKAVEEQPKKEVKFSDDIQKSLKAAELYTKKEDFEKAIEIYNEILSKDPENLIVQQRLREVYSFQEKKLEKLKSSKHKEEIKSNDKITAEDILDVMREAVKEEKAEEKVEVKPKEEKVAESIIFDEKKAKEIEKILKDLTNIDGLVGGIFLQKDGKIIASFLPPDINANEIGKDIAKIVDKTEMSVANMKQGKLNHVIIASEMGQLLFTEIGKGVLFMIGNEKINMGKMSYVLKDIVIKIKSVTS